MRQNLVTQLPRDIPQHLLAPCLPLTGESSPVLRRRGDLVHGGTRTLNGAIDVRGAGQFDDLTTPAHRMLLDDEPAKSSREIGKPQNL